MTTRIRLALVSMCTVALAACGGDSSGPPAVGSVSVSGNATGIVVGQTASLTATARDANGNTLTGRTVAWTTSAATIATVSNTGVVTGVAPGSATITATIESKTGTAAVTVVVPPVATVTVSATATTLQTGQTTQATAVTRDGSNTVVTGRVVTWTSSDQAVATVSATGVVTGLTAGAVTITATSEGKSGTVQITITGGNPADAPQITTVTPSPLVEGQAATITGTKFGASPAANVVRIGGVSASVTSATATSLQIIVPNLNCKPAQNVNVDVTVGGNLSAPKSQPFTPSGTPFTLAQGKQQIIANPADFCLQFPASGGSETYLIGVQSTSESGSSLTPVNFTGQAASAASSSAAAARTSAPPGTFAVPGLPASLVPSLVDPSESARALRISRHHAAESQIVSQELALMRPRVRSLARGARAMMNATASAARVPTVTGSAKVGDVLAIRVPDRSRNTCANFIPINVTVKAIGTNAIFVEDNANPTGGFSAADYQTLSTTFDTQIYPTDVSHFGAPTDMDINGHTVVVITKEVNKVNNLLGVVFLANFASQTECPSSNEGEFFYGRAPDPNGTAGVAYTIANALADAPIIVAHEFAHVIQFGRRLDYEQATAFQAVWELEGQATFAEEVNGYAATGLAPGQNLGAAVVFNQPQLAPINWFIDVFSELVTYYGFEGANKTPNAPEQCSWLSLKSQGNSGPCVGDAAVYGATWSLLRWISDQYGPTFPGGEKGLHKRLVENAFTGYATLSDVTGAPIDVLLAQWAAALYTDDRVGNLDPKLKFTSWNLKAIEDGITQTSARLAPRNRQFGAFTDQVSVRGGSTAYFLVSGNGRGATGIRARDAADGTLPAVMRLWVVRLQ